MPASSRHYRDAKETRALNGRLALLAAITTPCVSQSTVGVIDGGPDTLPRNRAAGDGMLSALQGM